LVDLSKKKGILMENIIAVIGLSFELWGVFFLTSPNFSKIEVLDKVPFTSSKAKQWFGAFLAIVITFLIVVFLFFLKDRKYWSIGVWFSGLAITVSWFPIWVLRVKHFTPFNARQTQSLFLEGFMLLFLGFILQSIGVVIQN